MQVYKRGCDVCMQLPLCKKNLVPSLFNFSLVKPSVNLKIIISNTRRFMFHFVLRLITMSLSDLVEFTNKKKHVHLYVCVCARANERERHEGKKVCNNFSHTNSLMTGLTHSMFP